MIKTTILFFCFFVLTGCASLNGNIRAKKMFGRFVYLNPQTKNKIDSCEIVLLKEKRFRFSCRIFSLGSSAEGIWELKNNKTIVVRVEKEGLSQAYPEKFYKINDTLKIINKNTIMHNEKKFNRQ